jgi:hypothetical protein
VYPLPLVNSVAHSTTLVPFPLLDSASLVIARAIQMDALDLDVSYDSLRDLLQRPRLGNTDRVDIPWKESFLNEPLFPLKYADFWEIWHRCLYIIGSRKDIRPYSLRVGAGARMDGTLISDTYRRWSSIDTLYLQRVCQVPYGTTSWATQDLFSKMTTRQLSSEPISPQ